VKFRLLSPPTPTSFTKPRNVTRDYIYFSFSKKKNAVKHARIRQKTQEDICYATLGGSLIPLIENWGKILKPFKNRQQSFDCMCGLAVQKGAEIQTQTLRIFLISFPEWGVTH